MAIRTTVQQLFGMLTRDEILKSMKFTMAMKENLDDALREQRFSSRRNWGVMTYCADTPAYAAFTSEAWMKLAVAPDVLVTIFYC